MGMELTYNETITIYKVSSSGYRGSKQLVDSADVACIFAQGTGFSHQNNQENVDADAVVYVDFEDEFITENANRLEGMYVLANIFDGTNSKSWFKIDSVAINRDHLINNQIDNIELRLKKTASLPGIS